MLSNAALTKPNYTILLRTILYHIPPCTIEHCYIVMHYTAVHGSNHCYQISLSYHSGYSIDPLLSPDLSCYALTSPFTLSLLFPSLLSPS